MSANYSPSLQLNNTGNKNKLALMKTEAPPESEQKKREKPVKKSKKVGKLLRVMR